MVKERAKPLLPEVDLRMEEKSEKKEILLKLYQKNSEENAPAPEEPGTPPPSKTHLDKNPKKSLFNLSVCLRVLVYGAAGVTFSSLIFLFLYIFINGVPHLKPSLFAFNYNSENVSMFPAMINTVLMIICSLAVAMPLGIFSAIYLVEYAKRGNKAVELIRLTAETLSGIPSIVYGLFGMLFFVTFLKWSFSLLAGTFTLGIMILPLIMRTTEEALKSVPDLYREASFGLGAGRIRTIYRIILPTAVPGILSGVILSIGRIVGETAALIYTAGTVAQIPEFQLGTKFFDGFFYSTRTLAVHMYALASEGIYTDQAYATAVVLCVVVLIINIGSSRIATKLTNK